MKNQRKIGLVFAALLLFAPQLAVSQGGDATDTFVKGATDFLLDRANDNYIYIFQKKLEANPFLQKYLPATVRLVKAGDIQSLISNKQLWRQALERDLVGDGDKLFTRVLGEWTQNVNKVCAVAPGKVLSDADTKLVDACNAALAQVGEVVNAWMKYYSEELCKAISAKVELDRCMAAVVQMEKTVEDTKQSIADAKKLSPQADGKSAASGASAAPKPSVPPDRALVYMFSPGAAPALNDLTRDLSQVDPAVCRRLKAEQKADKKTNYTACVIEILAILQALSQADYVVNCYLYGILCSNRGAGANLQEDGDFANFRRYALFFAQLADAADTNDRAQVNALLKSVTIPPVSFGIKREPHATKVLITAYLGGAGTRETGNEHTRAGGILAPVGVEISQATDGGNSFSLLLSPLDFGYPLTLKMKDTETTVKGSDVVVPAAYVLYGLKNYPLAAGVGYSRGRGVDNPDQRVGRIIILFAFDMPLFKLY